MFKRRKRERFPADEPYTCQNCETVFKGNYCPNCGQSKLNLHHPFSVLIVDILGNMYAFDTRLWKTLKSLLFKPGEMVRDYMNGKRVRYMPPFRFYIFISFVFFFLLNILTSKNIRENKENFISKPDLPAVVTDSLLSVSAKNPEVRREILTQIMDSKKRYKIFDESRSIAKRGLEGDSILSLKIADSILNIAQNDTAMWKDVINHYSSGVVFSMGESSDGDSNSTLTFDEMAKNPDFYVSKFLGYFSWSLFVLMPFYSLLLWLFFRRTQRHFLAHLIFAVNQHAFTFIVFTILILVNLIFPNKSVYPEAYLLWLLPLYFGAGARKLYSRKWRSIVWRMFMILFLYMFAIITAMVVVAYFAFSS